tara:strand:- start:124143 stop:125624 length:1482 start_codon:yes stop_codon:yes gene_type:complete
VVKVTASPISLEKLKNTVVLFATKGCTLGADAKAFDKLHGGLVSSALKNSRFDGEGEGVFTLPTPTLEGIDHILVGSLGNPENLTSQVWRRTAIQVAQAADKIAAKDVSLVVESIKGDKTKADTIAVAIVEGFNLAVYRFDKFRTAQKENQKPTLAKLSIQMKDDKEFKKQITLLEAQTEGANLARDLVNLPANYANPDYMAKMAKTLTKDGVKVQILGEKEMEKLGLNLLLAVGRASEQESRLIVMKYTGDKNSKDYKCIVGKGVMFDTGGYNLKRGAGMAQMKADMAGSAAVMGAIKALAKRKANVNVIAVCGCVMNMVGGDGFLPSDILTAYNGKTVEIGNTDAEGRLVLADAMSYIIDKEKPTEIIDIATLTGACMSALGGFYAGLFSNSDGMSTKLMASGEATGERLWRLPIDNGYAAKAALADLNNNGSPYGGASTAAVFLKQFVGETPWAHLDIAGVGIGDKIPGTSPLEGASGFGARLLVNYLES